MQTAQDGDGVPDVVIVGTRTALDYMICCADAGTAHDILMPSSSTAAFADTESLAAAMIRPPLDADGKRKTSADTAASPAESTKITVVFGTGTSLNEERGSVDYVLQIRAYSADGTSQVDRVDDYATDLNLNEKTLAQLPGSISGDKARVTHTVKFVETRRSASTDDSAHDEVENHLYLGYQHQDMDGTNGVEDASVLGHYYDPDDDDPDDLSDANRGPIGKDSTLTEFMKDGMRGMDVLVVKDPGGVDSTIQTAIVYLSSNGGSVYEIIPERVATSGTDSTLKLSYDRSSHAGVKLGAMRADGTTLDLSTPPATASLFERVQDDLPQ